jgi:hypothetical protein
MRAFVICFVKAIFIELALGLLASFCKNKITSEILQPSKSLLSKVVEPLFPILRKISALLLEKVSVVLGNFTQGVGIFSTPMTLPLKVGYLLAFETTSLVVVIVQTLVIFMAISSSLSHLACNYANILTLSRQCGQTSRRIDESNEQLYDEQRASHRGTTILE